MEFMNDFSDYIGTQQLNHDTTETSSTLQKTLYLLVNNEKKLLKLGENTVGRAEDADVRFNLDTVSYNHAIIECEPNDFFIKDLRSTNFTKRDGKVMKPYVVYELKSGTKLMFGNVEAIFYAIDDDQSTDQEQVTLPLIEEDITDQSNLNQSVSLLETSGPEVPEEIIPPSIQPKSPNKDQSNVNAKTRVLNESTLGTEESDNEGDSSIHDLETQKPSTNRGKRKKDIHDLETQYSPKQDDDENIHGLETQCSPPQRSKGKNIHDLETQVSPPPQRSTKRNNRNIYDLETQVSPPPQRSTSRNIHELETQRSPPHKSNKSYIYDLETQIPSDTKKSREQLSQPKDWDSEMYNMETQKPFSNHVDSEVDDVGVGENIQNEMYSKETQGKQIENKEEENNVKKKRKKKTKEHKVDTSSSEEEESDSRNTRLKTKRKKPTRTKKAAKENMSPKKVSEDSSTDIENLENNVKENVEEPKQNQSREKCEDKIAEVNDENEKILEDSMVENNINENSVIMTNTKETNDMNLNDTNSESFIGMVTGKKKRFILSSSSETDIEIDASVPQTISLENEPETKKLNSEQSSQINKAKNKPSDQSNKAKNKPVLDTTYDIVAQTSIDDLYRSEIDDAKSPNQTQEESQFIHVVNTQGPGNTVEPVESQFTMEEDEREEDEDEDEMVGSPSLLPPDSPSLIDQDTAETTADVEASSKNTTNYDVSEMDLDSFISGPETEGRKVINKRTVENSLDNNSSLLFSVSETELRPDFVQEDEEEIDAGTVKQSAKSDKTNDKDARKDTSLLRSTGPKPRKPLTRGKNKTSEESENSPEQTDKTTRNDKNKNNKIEIDDNVSEHSNKESKKNESKMNKQNKKDGDNGKKKPARKVLTKTKNAKKRKEDSLSGSSTESDFEIHVNEKTKHDTIQANQSEEATNQASGNRKNAVSKVAKVKRGKDKDSYETPEEDDFFDMATQKVTRKGKDPHPKPSEEDFFDMATQKVSIGPSETDDSYVAPKCQETGKSAPDSPSNASHHKNSLSSDTDDELFNVPDEKNKKHVDKDFFELATQQVSVGPSGTDDSFVAPTQGVDKDKDFFELATQQVSVGPSETDDSFVAPTQGVDKDFFELATQQVSVGPSETDDSFVAPTQGINENNDFFEMATQKVSIGPSETDDSFVAPTQASKDFFEVATQQVPSESAPSPKEKTKEDFFDMATQKMSVGPTSDEEEESFVAPNQKNTPHADFFEAATQQVSVNRMSEDFFEAATQRVSVEPSEKPDHEDQGSDKDLFDAPTQKLRDTKQDDLKSDATNDNRVDKQKSKKGKERLRNDSESSSFSFDSEVGKKKTNVRNNRKRNMNAEKEPEIPEEIGDECPKSKQNQRKIDKITINMKTNVIKEKKPETSSRKRNVKETTNEVSSDESEITFEPQEETKTSEKRETRVRKKNPKYEEDEDMASSSKKKTKESKNPRGKSRKNDNEEKIQTIDQNKNIENIETDTKNVSENIDENHTKSQRNKRGRKPTQREVNDSYTKTPHVDKANVIIEPTTPSRKRRHPLAIQHGIESSPQVSLDRIETSKSLYNKKRNATRDLTGTISESKKSQDTSIPEDFASNEKTPKLKEKTLEVTNNAQSKTDSQSKNNSQSKKQNQVTNIQDETFTIEESTSVKITISKTKTSLEDTPDEDNTKTFTADTSKRRGRKAKDKPETNTNTEEQEETIAENLNHEETTRSGKRMKRGGEKKEESVESEEVPEKKAKKGRPKKEHIASEEIPEKKIAKRGQKKEVDNAECSERKKAKNSENTEESNESQGTSRGLGRAGKLSSKRPTPPVALKKKETPVDESPMKPPCAPSTPKKARGIKAEPESSVKATPRGGLPDASIRSSPRSRARQPPDSANNTRGRPRSTSSSSDSVASDSTSSSSRRSTASVKKTSEIKVTFTMVDKPAKYITLLASLNASITDDPIISDILVTPKVARSLKFLQFLAMGKPIVTIKWLMDSEKCHKFLPHEKYILKDAEAEKTYGFNLERSITCARGTKLLDNYNVFVTNSVKPTPADMKGIIECSGGTFIPKTPSQWAPYSVIVTDPADSVQLKKLLAVPGSKPSVVNKEFILSGILQQKLDFVKYKF
ncbi:hypothetical protein WDU94_008395 [Cyamophila willieti]